MKVSICKKCLHISCNEENACKRCWFPCEIERTAGKLADALIEAGIVDKSDYASMKETAVRYKAEVSKAESRAKEAEHRAEVAERALDKATELAYTYRTQDDTLSCSSCPFDSIFDRCKERGLYEDCSKRWKEELLQQAEKELAEERKDD